MFHSIFVVTTSSVVDKDQNSYLKERKIDCGVVTGDKSEESSSRVMNAKPSTKTYSWTAQVTRKLFKDKKFISGNDEEYTIFNTQGSLISDMAVVTCAHCICNDRDVDKEWPYLITCGKENPTAVNRQNLNFKGKNEINVNFGKRTKVTLNDIEFDNNIIAYVYKYERNQIISKKYYKGMNGDVGIILMEKNIDLVRNRISPICLPNPSIFERKSVIDIKYVGWGTRSGFKFDPAGNVLDHACFTNGAREYDKALYPDTDGISIVPCELRKREEDGTVCMAEENGPNGFVKNGIYAISYKTNLMFKQDIIDKIKKDPKQEKCAEYMKEAEKKWVNARKFLYPDKNYAGIQIIERLYAVQNLNNLPWRKKTSISMLFLK